ncbi:unnamed protein product [Amaranthus hypochondriacus]
MDTKFTFYNWFGGKFVEKNAAVVYIGGMGRTFEFNPVDLCLKYLFNMGEMCVNSNLIEGLFYCVPGVPLKDGLRKILVEDDAFQPTRTGRRGRSIRSGIGARGGKSRRGRHRKASQPS